MRAQFDAGEMALLAGLPDQIRELVTLDQGLVRDRLFPHAYLDPGEAEAEEEWQRLMHADLLKGKLDALDVFESTLRGAGVGARGAGNPGPVSVELDEEEVAAWLGALNDLRLALGVLLNVTEDLDLGRLDPEDPGAAGLHLYGFLTWVQGEMIDAVNP